GSSLSAISKALRPLYADRTSEYSLESLASSSFSLASTSSTTSTRADMSYLFAPRRESARLRKGTARQFAGSSLPRSASRYKLRNRLHGSSPRHLSLQRKLP